MTSGDRSFDGMQGNVGRLVRQPRDRQWGTGNALEKGGDYFGAAAPRTSS